MWKLAPLSIIMHNNVIYSYYVVIVIIIILNPYPKSHKWLNKSWKFFGQDMWEPCDLIKDYVLNLVVPQESLLSPTAFTMEVLICIYLGIFRALGERF